MAFNTYTYVLFFPLVTGLYFALAHRHRWVLLLAASYYFYMCWEPKYALLMVASTLVDYAAGRLMGQETERTKRRKYLILSLSANLGLLFFFKYANFFNASLKLAFQPFNVLYDAPVFHFLLPMGISFYTFQTLSYTIDVYRGRKEPEKHLGIFALYVSFFPQLVAGPIERAERLLPQFFERHTFNDRRVSDGLRLILWGMFKKVVIADRLAAAVDAVYNYPAGSSGPEFVAATVFFAFQIFCDFSGYSDIAIGSAEVLGFRLMKNFDRPYASKSIPEFWTRWHISLSTWFRDYLYIPLGGNRVARWRWYVNILIVFLLSGLWHGAGGTFIVWGALHGSYFLITKASAPARIRLEAALHAERFPRLYAFFRLAITFSLVTFAWIFFRANSLSDAVYIVFHLFSGWSAAALYHGIAAGSFMGLEANQLFLSIALIIFLEMVQLWQGGSRLRDRIEQLPSGVRLIVYTFLVLIIFNAGVTDEIPFIYFQF